MTEKTKTTIAQIISGVSIAPPISNNHINANIPICQCQKIGYNNFKIERAYSEVVSHVHGMDGVGVRFPVGPQLHSVLFHSSDLFFVGMLYN